MTDHTHTINYTAIMSHDKHAISHTHLDLALVIFQNLESSLVIEQVKDFAAIDLKEAGTDQQSLGTMGRAVVESEHFSSWEGVVKGVDPISLT